MKDMSLQALAYRRWYDPFAEHKTLGKVVFFPLWAPCLLFAAYPMIALIRSPARRRQRRRGRGLCIECGYDLTGNMSGVCPECGTKIEKA